MIDRQRIERSSPSTILCVMRMPPSLQGHGGSQRAWALVEALRQLAPVHFVLIGRKLDEDVASVSLEPLRPLVESLTSIDIPDWQPLNRDQLPVGLRKMHTGWVDLAGMRCQEAPRLSRAGVEALQRQLPVQHASVLFAGRLPTAVIMDQVLETGRLTVDHKVVDFDDVMSKFRRRQIDRESVGVQTRLLHQIDARLIEKAEAKVAQAWDAVSVCTEEDTTLLSRRDPGARVLTVPNILSRPRLAPPPLREDGAAEALFVGNLGFAPNVQGLLAFLKEAWPSVQARAKVKLTVVGLNPKDAVRTACAAAGAELLANVADLQPYYARCHLVIAPILFGGGTRIKIIEAMAYGRPIVSSTMGAEGLHITSGEHALLADDMPAFADAVVALADDPSLRARLTAEARALQEARFSFNAMASAVKTMVGSYL